MKKGIVLLITSVFITFKLSGQSTAIPDTNFEQALIDLGYDTVIDGSVLTANINTVSSLDITNKNISDLTGIEGFTLLSTLNCSNNNLSTINVSNNIYLGQLYFASNNLSTIDLSSNIYLFELNCEFNNLTGLDLSSLLDLRELYCSNNSITNLDLLPHTNLRTLICDFNNIISLDLSTNTFGSLEYITCSNNALEFLNLKSGFSNLITSFNAEVNPNLLCIQVDDVNHFNSNWASEIDMQTGFNTNCLETYIPDNNFEQALIDLGLDSGPLDNYVLNENINTITSLDVSSKSIIELTGLEGFLALETIDCSNNNLFNFYYPDNTNLTTVDCSNNQINFVVLSTLSLLTNFNCDNNPDLNEIDLSANTLLTDLSCKNTGLDDLILTTNTALISLSCESNNLTTINFTTNTALTTLTAQNNNLSSLFIKNGNNTNITTFNTTNNPSLTCIEVDSPNYSLTNWTNIDAQTIFSIDCAFPQTYVPDDNFEQKLIDLGYDIVLDDYVLTTNINTVSFLPISSNNISDLTGIEDFTALTVLDCKNNQLTSLDISNNTLLTELICRSNDITSLDLSNNTALTKIECSANNLTSLDLSNNTLLTELICRLNDIETLNLSANTELIIIECDNNELTSLNLNNGNNTTITIFDATNNSNLFCIKVDDTSYANTNWTNIDAQTVFDEDCNGNTLTFIPDNNFEQALIDLGYDDLLNGNVLTSNINTITNLDISNKSINNLTGIEGFTALTTLDCHSNGMSSIDLSQNTLLNYLDCSQMGLDSIDLSNNTQLTTLLCSSNNLTDLNLSTNTSLEILDFGYNSISSINLSSNTQLQDIECQHNQLTSLDLSANTALNSLKCIVNNITDLDLSANSNLTYLYCVSNDLSTLRVDNGNNTNITFLNFTNNPNLSCIQVDDPTYSFANWQFFAGDYSLDCHYGETYIPDDNFEQALINLGYDSVLDDYVTTSNIDTITSLNVSSQNISDLTGIEDFIALINLDCEINNLTNLDVSNLTALTHLACNQNDLVELIVQNGNNTNIISFNATNNTNLTCIEVDDATYSTNNWFNIDAQVNYSEECFFNDTYILDNNFEQALIDLGYDSGPLNNYVPTVNIESIISLDLANKNISDLTGINDFTALEYLVCTNNNISSLNISSNTNLFSLDCTNNNLTELNLLTNINLNNLSCSFNSLTELNLISNVNLQNLVCNDNNLTELNLISNVNLQNLICNNNNLTELDLQTNINLNNLSCSFNNLIELNLTSNVNLQNLICNNNNLTNLDLSTNTLVTELEIQNNLLTTLDLSLNTALTNINCSVNPLTSTGLNIKNGTNNLITNFSAVVCPTLICIKVDDAVYSTTNWTNVDSQTYFGEDCLPLTYVPDDNFEQALINLGYDTAPLDDYVFTQNIDTVTNLDLSNLAIQDLTGIQDFISLSSFNCSNNNIQDLDLSSNTVLTSLNCSTNNLESLNMQNGNALNITFFDTTNNIELDCIQVDDITYSQTNWTSIDPQTNFSLDCVYGYTYVPDDNFELALNEMLLISEPLDNYIKTSYIENLNSVVIINKNISDLTGIEDFISLKGLNCNGNNLTSLDLSNNIDLENLFANQNSLSTLDLTNNTNLKMLEVNNNNLTSLLIPGFLPTLLSLECENNNLTNLGSLNTPNLELLKISNNNISDVSLGLLNDLTFFICSNNNITDLNFSNNSSLVQIKCDNNNLSTLLLQNGNNTSITNISFSAFNNPDLKCILVDDQTYSNENWSNIDAQTTFNETDCHYDETYIPDNNFEQALIDLGYDTVLDDYVLTTNINTATSLNVKNKNINDLTGIEGFIALEVLNCSQNNLTSLDVSLNLALQNLNCAFNNIISLDVSKNTSITSLACNHNSLTTLNVKNGNNSNFTLFVAVANYQLECIQVDDVIYSATNWTNIEPISSFNNDCSSFTTFVPDNNFEQALIEFGYDNLLDNYVVTANINTITILNVSARKIHDLTGIEAFEALTELSCNTNNLTELDISSNTMLSKLYLTNNRLTELDVSSNTSLTELFCNGNNLANLDVSSNTMLAKLECRGNANLTSLNVKNGNNNNFTIFSADSNPNLTCIEVDDVAYSSANWINIDTTANFSTNCPDVTIIVAIKVFLQGPLLNPDVSGLMNDDLRAANYIPTTSPYSDGANCNVSVFSITGNNAIVDWVWVELRASNDNTKIINARSALLQRDGDVVDLDGTSILNMFANPTNYYVVVKHRNHLGAMTNNAKTLSDNFVTTVDFRDSSFSTFSDNAQVQLASNQMALWAGNVNGDDRIRYQGSNNDSNAIKDLVIDNPGNTDNNNLFFYFAYDNADVNMDGRVRYQGSENDTNLIKDIIIDHPANGDNNNLFFFTVQLPENN